MRTVRSAAKSRNRPRRRLAWLLVLILLVLLALAARVDAAAGGDPIDPVVRAADVLRPADGAAAGVSGGDDEEVAAMKSAAGRDAAERDAAERDAAERDAAERDAAERDAGGGDPFEQIDEIGELGRARDGAPGDDPLAEATTPGEPAGVVAAGGDAPAEPAPTDLGSGASALLDSELAPEDAAAAAAAAEAAASAGAAELREQSVRRAAASRWGRVDVGLAWRRRWRAPRNAPPSRHHEIWLVATWRR